MIKENGKRKKGKRKENIERKNRVKNRVRTKKRDLTGNRRRVRRGIKRKTEKLSQGTKWNRQIDLDLCDPTSFIPQSSVPHTEQLGHRPVYTFFYVLFWQFYGGGGVHDTNTILYTLTIQLFSESKSYKILAEISETESPLHF